MKKIALFSIFMLSALFTFAQDITKGTWYNAEKTSRVQFYKVGDKLYGKVVWLKEPVRNGKERTDELNPDVKKRNVPLMGLVFMKNFKQVNAKEWEDGTIYDPNNGKTYSCVMTLESPEKLNVRGYIGISLIGRTSVFTRATKE